MSEVGVPEAASDEIDRQGSLYVFPGPGRQHYPGSASLQSTTATVPDASTSVPTSTPSSSAFAKSKTENENADEEIAARGRRRPCSRTHARSASHGGVLAECLTNTGLQPHAGSYLGPLSAIGGSRPSALKKPGHQRAFSQGQVIDVQGHSVMGHSRVGSRTDFILPPGHREDSRPPTAGKVPSFRGHSRQASRYLLFHPFAFLAFSCLLSQRLCCSFLRRQTDLQRERYVPRCRNFVLRGTQNGLVSVNTARHRSTTGNKEDHCTRGNGLKL